MHEDCHKWHILYTVWYGRVGGKKITRCTNRLSGSVLVCGALGIGNAANCVVAAEELYVIETFKYAVRFYSCQSDKNKLFSVNDATRLNALI